MEQIDRLMIIQDLFDGPADLIIPFLNSACATRQPKPEETRQHGRQARSENSQMPNPKFQLVSDLFGEFSNHFPSAGTVYCFSIAARIRRRLSAGDRSRRLSIRRAASASDSSLIPSANH